MAASQETVDTPTQPSLFHGPTTPPLLQCGLAEFLDEQCFRYGSKEAIVTPWDGQRWTYTRIQYESKLIARYLLSVDISNGDRVAILAGNRVEYAAVFFACARIGAILVILNNTYVENEATYALQYTESKILFTTARIGPHIDNTRMVSTFATRPKDLPALERVILLTGSLNGCETYSSMKQAGLACPAKVLEQAQAKVDPYETCNLQFTSGSTGSPKASRLNQHGLLNNSRFIGDRMALTPSDILCCPPPLFHCFGLVLGLLAVITHGSSIVYPGEIFDGALVLSAISNERCTAVHGVPAMFDILFSLPLPDGFDCSALRTGIIAGAPVPRPLMRKLLGIFGMTEFTSSYGLTEASPTCFNAFVDDPIDAKLNTVGTVMPHASVKVVNRQGRIVPVGTRGELCMAGYQLQQGYWRNQEKTDEVMIRDSEGTLWLHTGDEAFIDKNGYCTITGRFKDIIIRGGENIYPSEIEERLIEHKAIDRAIVVGLPDTRYGESVAAFLQRAGHAERLSLEQVQAWTREKLGRHKAPVRIFYLGEDGVSAEIPVTGSGKIKKFEMRRIAQELVARPQARL